MAESVALYNDESLLAGHRQPLPKVLKLHCAPGEFGKLPARLDEVAELGFEEVAVDLPWSLGIAEACGTLRGLVASWA